MKQISITIMIMLICFSAHAQKVALTGKIALDPTHGPRQYYENVIIIDLQKNKRSKFHLPPSSRDTSYCWIEWLNTQDLLLVLEKIRGRNNIVTMNTKGQVVETIYQGQKREDIIHYIPSPDDTKLLVTSCTTPENASVDERLQYALSGINDIYIVDLINKKTIRKMEKFYPHNNFRIYSKPWSPDQSRFVYSIYNSPYTAVIKDSAGDKEYGINRSGKENGIYIYNIEQDKHQLIIKDGNNASWSPTGQYIAYQKYNSIWMYDTKKDSCFLFYPLAPIDNVFDYCWSPDGKYIFINYMQRKISGRGSYKEKLISIIDKKEVKFKPFNVQYNSYSWKK